MKVAVVLCFVATLTVAAALPPPGGFGGAMPPAAAGAFVHSPAMVQSFVPTPEEINALNALHSTPAPATIPAPVVAPGAPTAPPTMPPAVANLVKKYQAAAAAFMPPAAGAA
ncbi:uncharacterized protein LOC134764404 [Penaeus indicus]|uniref:uncharacterized protein LOC134764404 n=1 Tax=Penaeus indicus TaxID=29960 RepID=UPI00300C91CB